MSGLFGGLGIQRPAGSLTRLFAPRSIAVVGASPSPGKIGNVLLRNLASFQGAVHPVHPTAREVLGRPAYPDVQSIPEPVDLALLVVPPDAVPACLEDCAAASDGGAVIYSGGWGEVGGAGAARQELVRAAAEAAGIRVLGPNTSGFLAPAQGLYATFVADLAEVVTPGPLAIVAQSGGVNLTLCFLARAEGLGVAFGVGVGNASDVGLADALDHAAQLDGVRAIALAIEGVADGRALFEAVARTTPRVPVVALKVGRTDVEAFAKSHTGAMAGSHRVTRAALAQAGAVLVDDLTELIDAARALCASRLPPSATPGVGVVTGQAGPGLLLADALAVRGVSVPPLAPSVVERLGTLLPPLTWQKNPVDTGRPGPTFREVVEVVRRADGIDLLAVNLLHEPDAVDPLAALRGLGPAVVSSAGPADEIARARDRLFASGIPLYPTPERAALAAAALVRDAQGQARGRERTHERREGASFPMRDGPRPTRWDEALAKDLLESVGIATPRRVVASTRAEAHTAFARLGAPVVVKVLHPSVTHKTEVGGVHVGVRDAASLDRALDAIERTAGARFLVEEQADGGPELLVAARRDPSFGAIVVVGVGGVGVEREDDLVVRLAPLSTEEAGTMLGELKQAWRYRGFRGAPAVNESDLARIVRALGDLVLARDDLAEVEVNPLRVTSRGLVALDAVAVAR